MGGAHRMAGVVVATPTSLLPHPGLRSRSRSRQIWPESESESVKICRLRLRLASVGGIMVSVFGISIFTERQLQLGTINQINGSNALFVFTSLSVIHYAIQRSCVLHHRYTFSET